MYSTVNCVDNSSPLYIQIQRCFSTTVATSITYFDSAMTSQNEGMRFQCHARPLPPVNLVRAIYRQNEEAVVCCRGARAHQINTTTTVSLVCDLGI